MPEVTMFKTKDEAIKAGVKAGLDAGWLTDMWAKYGGAIVALIIAIAGELFKPKAGKAGVSATMTSDEACCCHTECAQQMNLVARLALESQAAHLDCCCDEDA